MFRGISSLNLDAKGRLAIPTKYREQLVAACSAELVITVDKDHCLLIYPKPTWLEIEEKLRSLPSFDETARFLQRLYIGNAHEIDMDSQGRILLPQELRRFADLNKKVALVGQINKFELWDETAWNSRQEAQLAKVDINKLDLPEEFKSLSI
ncbi:MAG: division/cell wall cluster transcriptional repressor MraZ [Candidatus Thiodiazotropha endolucinida]|uniref:division/cell wall cluster transcriptional repressor MraZ n=1 Tax=Candidatus Thiodiazotropha sp. LNASS1 TaxID=3096260 RepID=UPI000D35CB65|nr:division/cell wall cluster transcriptional repressor MraZ [Candidatus Thiodiazotropha sp. (ex. Lucinisca nassula)]MBW9276052.1 division/cell wall cluster transcriptional repressor MraZ [Candidatus Thiodiazotropha sp. (ex. Lucinisca nassula)]MCU7941183.1 division/cell wall cluster transcriptional repressor MraZ [Candidatus Thiodiazotropha sp. (ex Cardiolucina cf. quadrata)]PUB83605.1 MAG: cell division/cell wall cluster transcriptional repressor MraZ [gamma proteobacterium symbiont of Ctena or